MTLPVLLCPYCSKPANLVTGRDVYPHRTDLYTLWFYQCVDCDARVGCHPKTKVALGTLANVELRTARSLAHKHFDVMWREIDSGYSRSEAYAWLANQLHIPITDCHIGQFDIETCNNIVNIMRNYYDHTHQ